MDPNSYEKNLVDLNTKKDDKDKIKKKHLNIKFHNKPECNCQEDLCENVINGFAKEQQKNEQIVDINIFYVKISSPKDINAVKNEEKYVQKSARNCSNSEKSNFKNRLACKNILKGLYSHKYNSNGENSELVQEQNVIEDEQTGLFLNESHQIENYKDELKINNELPIESVESASCKIEYNNNKNESNYVDLLPKNIKANVEENIVSKIANLSISKHEKEEHNIRKNMLKIVAKKYFTDLKDKKNSKISIISSPISDSKISEKYLDLKKSNKFNQNYLKTQNKVISNIKIINLNESNLFTNEDCIKLIKNTSYQKSRINDEKLVKINNKFEKGVTIRVHKIRDEDEDEDDESSD